MTVFGIVLGSWVAGVGEPRIVVLAGLGASLAMGFSGFFGAFMAEKAEREGHLRKMEEATGNNVESIHYEAARFVTIYVATGRWAVASHDRGNIFATFLVRSNRLGTLVERVR